MFHDDNPYSFARFLQFCYYERYQLFNDGTIYGCLQVRGPSISQVLVQGGDCTKHDDPGGGLADDRRSLSNVHFRMCVLADKYCMDGLKSHTLAQSRSVVEI